MLTLRGLSAPEDATPTFSDKASWAAAFVEKAKTQVGAKYNYSANVSVKDPDPKSHGIKFSCSQLVKWAAAQVGIYDVPEGSKYQQEWATKIPVNLALNTVGALLFYPGHVAISLGNGRQTVEAANLELGVIVNTPASNDKWKNGGLIPAFVPAAGETDPIATYVDGQWTIATPIATAKVPGLSFSGFMTEIKKALDKWKITLAQNLPPGVKIVDAKTFALRTGVSVTTPWYKQTLFWGGVIGIVGVGTAVYYVATKK